MQLFFNVYEELGNDIQIKQQNLKCFHWLDRKNCWRQSDQQSL